jgi:hypothetical protein
VCVKDMKNGCSSGWLYEITDFYNNINSTIKFTITHDKRNKATDIFPLRHVAF